MKTRNTRYIVTYVLAVLFILFAALFYRQSVLTALLLLMLLLPVISLVLCYAFKDRLKIYFDTLPLATSSGPDMKLKLKMNVENSGFIPFLNCRVSFVYRNRFYESEKKNELIFAAPPKSLRSYDFIFDTPYPGMFELEMNSLKITDFLHLKTWDISFDKSVKTALLPKDTNIDNILIKKTPLEEDAEKSLTGEISREVRQIREYAPGDKLRDMHWKQTARLDTPMVREFERMRESFYVLYPALSKDKTGAAAAGRTKPESITDDFRNTLSVWHSLALKLIKQGETVYTVIFEPDGRSYEKYKAASEDELIRTVYKLYCAELFPDTDTDSLINRLREEIPDITVIYKGKILQTE